MKSHTLVMILLALKSAHGFYFQNGKSYRSMLRDNPLKVSSQVEPKQELDGSPRSAKYAWDKEPPKKSLAIVGQSHTASQFWLNMVEASHWLSIFPNFVSCYAILKYHDFWFHTFFGDDALRLTLWCLAPIIQSIAGFAPIMAHLYEDWQIAPYTPPDETAEDNYAPDVYANERLRQVSYSLLFTLLGLSSVMSVHAFQGWEPSNALAPAHIGLSLGLLTYACLGDKTNLISKYVNPLLGSDLVSSNMLPVGISKLVFFVYSQISAAFLVCLPLAGQFDSTAIKVAVLLPQVLYFVGGTTEGVVAERNFDQRYHILAASTLVVGTSIQCWGLLQIGQVLS